MKKKIIIPLTMLTLLLSFYAASWTPSRPKSNWLTEEELLAMVDNTTPKEQLVTKKYKFGKKTENYVWKPIMYLGSYSAWQQTMLGTPYLYSFRLDELNKYYEIQCLRQPDQEHLYAVFCDKKGNNYYALFKYADDGENSHWYVVEYWYPQEKIYKADFEALEIGVATYEDVKKIDRYAQVFSYNSVSHLVEDEDLYSGETHITDTWDGHALKIFYSKEDNTVAEVRLIENDEYSLHTYLLPMDLPE